MSTNSFAQDPILVTGPFDRMHGEYDGSTFGPYKGSPQAVPRLDGNPAQPVSTDRFENNTTPKKGVGEIGHEQHRDRVVALMTGKVLVGDRIDQFARRRKHGAAGLILVPEVLKSLVRLCHAFLRWILSPVGVVPAYQRTNVE